MWEEDVERYRQHANICRQEKNRIIGEFAKVGRRVPRSYEGRLYDLDKSIREYEADIEKLDRRIEELKSEL